jgi:outer membrane protein W
MAKLIIAMPLATAAVLTTDHKLDPWVVSAGLYARF